MASSVLCPACTGKGLGSVYTAPLIHSSEEEGDRVKAIDVSVELIGAHVRICRLDKNIQYVVAEVPAQIRARYLPPIHVPVVTTALRTCWLAGSLALDWQRELNPAHCMVMGLAGF